MHVYGVEMQLPEGKRPGYYARFVKALAANVRLADRDKELLIVEDEAQREALIALLNEYKFEYEEFELLRLPEQAETTPLFADYGFVSIAERAYLYGHLCAVFRFVEAAGDAGSASADAASGASPEPAQAVRQMEEHLIARFPDNGRMHFAVDRTLTELMRGIARAYKCAIEFVSH